MPEMTPDEIERLNRLASSPKPSNTSNLRCPECDLPFYEDESRIITDECVCGWKR